MSSYCFVFVKFCNSSGQVVVELASILRANRVLCPCLLKDQILSLYSDILTFSPSARLNLLESPGRTGETRRTNARHIPTTRYAGIASLILRNLVPSEMI